MTDEMATTLLSLVRSINEQLLDISSQLKRIENAISHRPRGLDAEDIYAMTARRGR